jgi:hypothetical protein
MLRPFTNRFRLPSFTMYMHDAHSPYLNNFEFFSNFCVIDMLAILSF